MAVVWNVILSGGIGSRLWPFSRSNLPKQFHDIVGIGRPLLTDSVERVKKLGKTKVLTTRDLDWATMGLLKSFHQEAEIICEPYGKNTAPATLYVSLLALREDPNAVVSIIPADHLVGKVDAFREVLEQAINEASKNAKIVTIGIEPHHPATGYGYIQLDKTLSELKSSNDVCVAQVRRFIEKPHEDKARQLIKEGRSVWNAGIFVFPAKLMVELFQQHAPDIYKAFENCDFSEESIQRSYDEAPKDSLDYAIMEHSKEIVCIPADIDWSDVGSWEEVKRQRPAYTRQIEVAGANNYYANIQPTSKTVAFVGTSDTIVIDTADALLILNEGDGQRMRECFELVKTDYPSLAQNHSFEERPWGRFEILQDLPYYKSKRIIVRPGQRLSYQSHEKRAENWTVIQGEAEVTLNDETQTLKTGEHIYIPVRAKHRIANTGTVELEFIEVQTGEYFGEEDITRYSDDYGRK